MVRSVAPNSPDRMFPGAPKVVWPIMKKVARGSTRVLPRGGTRGTRSPQCPLQHVHLCLGRSG